ncbi:MAG: hypothetical protein WCL06_00025 [Bacteroidota bacterium]
MSEKVNKLVSETPICKEIDSITGFPIQTFGNDKIEEESYGSTPKFVFESSRKAARTLNDWGVRCGLLAEQMARWTYCGENEMYYYFSKTEGRGNNVLRLLKGGV